MRHLRSRRSSTRAIFPFERDDHTRGEDYPFQQPSPAKKKMRRLELQTGAPRYQGGRSVWSTNEAMRMAERELALQAPRAYERTATFIRRTSISPRPARLVRAGPTA